MDTRKLLAELVGTFVFFLIGLMSILSTKAFSNGPDLVVIAFGFGLGLFAAIQIGGAVSGGHFNPAVTLATVLDKRLDPMTGVGYVVAQLIGGIAAAAFVLVMSSQDAVRGTITGHPSVSDLQAVVIEAVFTAIFIAVILTVTELDPGKAAFAIPLTLVVIHLALVPITGSSVNPARSLASALIGGDLSSIWVYIVGPLVGSVGGWAVYRALIDKPAAA
ncbi:MAG TPA: aquaporin [Candidatus Limnocylindrales bacterium]|jgi:MIP family channel proteins